MHRSFYDRTRRQVRDVPSGQLRIYLDLEVRRVHGRRCAVVQRERLELLAHNPYYRKRFAFYYIGRRCRSATIKNVAEELRLLAVAIERDRHRAQARACLVPELNDLAFRLLRMVALPRELQAARGEMGVQLGKAPSA